MLTDLRGLAPEVDVGQPVVIQKKRGHEEGEYDREGRRRLEGAADGPDLHALVKLLSVFKLDEA